MPAAGAARPLGDAGVAAFAGRVACVDLPYLPLQLLLRREPDWRRFPAAVVEADKPQARILWTNERAYRAGVRAGRRFAEGLSMCAGLRAGVVEPTETAAAVDGLLALLRRFSPRVEPDAREPGVLRADLRGLGGLYAGPEEWARALADALRAAGWRASVAVGFDRFRTYALARMSSAEGRAVRVCADRAEEVAATDGVPLARLHVDPGLRDALDRLGVTDVGDLRALPSGGLLARFGEDGARLQSEARDGGGAGELEAVEEAPTFRARFELEPDQPSIEAADLLFVLKQRLGTLIDVLVARGEAVGGIDLLLLPDRSRAADAAAAGPVRTSLEPAEATLDTVQLVDLLRLRIELLDLRAPLVGFELEVLPVPATRAQLELFGEEASRDLRAANRALARLRAEFGDDAVVRARLRPGHLPEGTWSWERLEHLGRATARPVRTGLFDRREEDDRQVGGRGGGGRQDGPEGDGREADGARGTAEGTEGAAEVAAEGTAAGGRTLRGPAADGGSRAGEREVSSLVRRFLRTPRPVRGPGLEPDGWFVGGLDAGTVRSLSGPYVVSGGWWRNAPDSAGSPAGEVHREYHFAETRRGDVLWLFRDRGRRRWYVQGVVE